MRNYECPTCGRIMEQNQQDRDEYFCPDCGNNFVVMLDGKLFSLPPLPYNSQTNDFSPKTKRE